MCLLMLQPWSVYRTVCSVQAKVLLPWQRPPDAGSALSSSINMEYLYNTVRESTPGPRHAGYLQHALSQSQESYLLQKSGWGGGQHLNRSSDNTAGHRALLFRSNTDVFLWI